MELLEVLILGSYLAVLLYVWLLDVSKTFLNYMSDLSEFFINKMHIKNMHPYSGIVFIVNILAITSWVGLGFVLYFITDSIICKVKYEKN